VDVIPRQDPDFEGPYAKDPADEDLLRQLNAALAPVEESAYLDVDEEHPTLHVVGVPRSGTTLLHQVLAAGLEIGYVDNLTAAFWRAPVFGLRLARKLGVRDSGPSFDSSFGRTRGVGEPHEFGYFWNHHLRYPGLYALPEGHEETIDWTALRTVLVNMACWERRPMLFKPMLLTWHLERMARELPRTRYVWIRRDLHETALSLLSMREALHGSLEVWASLRPHGPDWLADEPPWRQVAAQAIELERTIAGAAERLGGAVLAVDYEELCAAPEDVVERVRALLASTGSPPARRPTALAPFQPRRNERLERQFGDLVDEALEYFTAALR
jgi:hypothetical protein